MILSRAKPLPMQYDHAVARRAIGVWLALVCGACGGGSGSTPPTPDAEVNPPDTYDLTLIYDRNAGTVGVSGPDGTLTPSPSNEMVYPVAPGTQVGLAYRPYKGYYFAGISANAFRSVGLSAASSVSSLPVTFSRMRRGSSPSST